jgi:hypothetical protein
MAILTNEQFNRGLGKIAKHSAIFNNMVQEMLISAAYYAFKEGSTTEFNRLITACGNGVHVKALTRWIELVSGIGRVLNNEIVLNKKVRDMSGVIDYETFKPFEAEMRKITWYDFSGEQKKESVFDEGAYMKRVIQKLTKEGYAGLAAEIQQAELKYLAQQAMAVTELVAEEVTE